MRAPVAKATRLTIPLLHCGTECERATARARQHNLAIPPSCWGHGPATAQADTPLGRLGA